MRELKFRVWDKVDERMKYAEMEWFDDMFAFRFDHRGFEEEDNTDVVIMQYTGLKDKNGVEIYEGDIGCFDIGCFDIGKNSPIIIKIEKGAITYSSLFDMGHEFEVTGNIYETKPCI